MLATSYLQIDNPHGVSGAAQLNGVRVVRAINHAIVRCPPNNTEDIL